MTSVQDNDTLLAMNGLLASGRNTHVQNSLTIRGSGSCNKTQAIELAANDLGVVALTLDIIVRTAVPHPLQ